MRFLWNRVESSISIESLIDMHFDTALGPFSAKVMLASVRIRNLQLAPDDEADAVFAELFQCDSGIAKMAKSKPPCT